MKKVYYLSTCDTCKRILSDVGLNPSVVGFIFQDIKTEPVTAQQLEEMKKLAGSYEALFSRRAIKYKDWNLKDKTLNDQDYKNYILQEYTFLKRPVIVMDSQIFIGSEKKSFAALKLALGK